MSRTQPLQVKQYKHMVKMAALLCGCGEDNLRLMRGPKLSCEQKGSRRLDQSSKDDDMRENDGHYGSTDPREVLFATDEDLMSQANGSSRWHDPHVRLNRTIAALDTLSQHDRELLEMRYVEQLNSAEIAQSLGISKKTAESRILSALLRLKDRLESDP